MCILRFQSITDIRPVSAVTVAFIAELETSKWTRSHIWTLQLASRLGLPPKMVVSSSDNQLKVLSLNVWYVCSSVQSRLRG